jgi:WD40 repeat protein
MLFIATKGIMKFVYIILSLHVMIFSLHGAALDIHQSKVPLHLVHNGKQALRADIYATLCKISKTLQDIPGQPEMVTRAYDSKDYTYYVVDKGISLPMLGYLYSYNQITGKNYILTLSTSDLATLHSEANFWGLDNESVLLFLLVTRVTNPTVLNILMTSHHECGTFMHACARTNLILADALAADTHHFFMSRVYQPIQVISAYNKRPTCVSISANGLLVVGFDNGAIDVYKPNEYGLHGHVTSVIHDSTSAGYGPEIIYLSIAQDGTFTSGSRNKIVKTWKINDMQAYTCTLTESIAKYPVSEMDMLRFARDEKNNILYLGADNGTITISQLDGNNKIKSQETITAFNYCSVTSLALSADKILYAGSMNGIISIWKKSEIQSKHLCIYKLFDDKTNLSGCKNSINCLTAAEGKLYAGSSDGTIKIWEIPFEFMTLEQQLLLHWKNVCNINLSDETLHQFPEYVRAIYATLPTYIKDYINLKFKPVFYHTDHIKDYC